MISCSNHIVSNNGLILNKRFPYHLTLYLSSKLIEKKYTKKEKKKRKKRKKAKEKG